MPRRASSTALAGVTDPEAKRKIIGRLFVEVFDEEAHKLTGVQFLAQGTIYPDVIESAGARTGKAHVIKSHHNVGGLPEKMHLKLVEPLRELFKDEVRRARRGARAAARDGLPPSRSPGPGWACASSARCARSTPTCCARPTPSTSRSCASHDLYDKTSQAFAVFLPVRSVGVMGDGRRYDYVVALRAVETIDFMTAHWARLPYDFLDHVSRRIVNEVAGHLARGLRHLGQAAGDDRVGVNLGSQDLAPSIGSQAAGIPQSAYAVMAYYLLVLAALGFVMGLAPPLPMRS